MTVTDTGMKELLLSSELLSARGFLEVVSTTLISSFDSFLMKFSNKCYHLNA